MSFCLSVCVCLSACPSASSLPMSVCVCLSCVCPSIRLAACPSVCLSVFLSVCLCVCLPGCLHVYLCTLPTGFCPTTTTLCSPKHNKCVNLFMVKMSQQLMKSDWTRNIIWVHLAPNNSIYHTIIALQRTR